MCVLTPCPVCWWADGLDLGGREAASLCGRRWGGWNCSSQQSCWFRVPWSHSLSAGSVALDQMCEKLAGLLSAAAALLAAGALKIRVQFLKYFFFPRGFHEDTHVCPCCSLQATAVNSTSCKTCFSQVSISHLQQWPGRSVSGGC